MPASNCNPCESFLQNIGEITAFSRLCVSEGNGNGLVWQIVPAANYQLDEGSNSSAENSSTWNCATQDSNYGGFTSDLH